MSPAGRRVVFGKLLSRRRTTGQTKLTYTDVVYKRDLRALDIDIESWESLAIDHSRKYPNQQLETGEEKLMNVAADKRARRKDRINSNSPETK